MLRLETNLKARRERHKKVFAKTAMLSSALAKLNFAAIPRIFSSNSKKNQKNLQTPANRLFKSYTLAVMGLFLIGAVTPSNALSYSSFYTSEVEGLGEETVVSSALMADQEGYIAKINPQTVFGDRTSTNTRLIHTVAAGETISTIAEGYGLKTNTLLWENGLSATAKIRVGDQLSVPPRDGVTHTVQKGEDVKKIASTYKVSEEAISKQNSLENKATLAEGQVLFIPDAQPLPKAEPDRNTPARIASSTRTAKSNVGSTLKVSASTIGASSDSKPVGKKPFIAPTRGVITQGFKGHFAFDIANRDKPPIWAAGDGVVVKASSGTWGGGYGNHVIIDHGNGLQTLYAHMEYLSVSVGDKVKQGQVIGKMGRTGNVRGVTGIHLHFEVRQNGVKKVPSDYY